MSAIHLNLDDDNPICTINGLHAVLDRAARSNIVKLAGLSDDTISTIRRTSGPKFANQVLRSAFNALKNRTVTLAFDGPTITRVVSPDSKKIALSPQQIVPLLEMLVSKGMNIWGLQMSPDGTSANIQIVDPSVREHPTQRDEAVSIGRSFHWDALGGTSVHDFVQRMFCSNGNVMHEDGKAIRVLRADMDPAMVYSTLFIEGAEKKLARHFERIQRLQEIRLSVREWEQIESWLAPYEDDTDVFRQHFGSSLGKMEWKQAYIRHGIDLDDLSREKKKNCQTPLGWWDTINCMTWLASHPNDSGVSSWDQGKLLTFAGKQTQRASYDADMWMTNLPSFN
jgi:hypothetical protein